MCCSVHHTHITHIEIVGLSMWSGVVFILCGVLYEVAASACKFSNTFSILFIAFLVTPVADTTHSCTFKTAISNSH